MNKNTNTWWMKRIILYINDRVFLPQGGAKCLLDKFGLLAFNKFSKMKGSLRSRNVSTTPVINKSWKHVFTNKYLININSRPFKLQKSCFVFFYLVYKWINVNVHMSLSIIGELFLLLLCLQQTLKVNIESVAVTGCFIRVGLNLLWFLRAEGIRSGVFNIHF